MADPKNPEKTVESESELTEEDLGIETESSNPVPEESASVETPKEKPEEKKPTELEDKSEEEEKTKEEPSVKEGEEKLSPYTSEELEEILKGGLPVDEDRLPEAEKRLHKSLHADYTRKTQQLAEQRKQTEIQLAEIEQIKKQFQSPQSEDEKAFALYCSDSVEFNNRMIQYKGQLRETLRQTDPSSQEYVNIQQQIDNCDQLKEQYSVKKEKLINQHSFVNQRMNQLITELRTAIPDYDATAPQMIDFAEKEIGLNRDLVMAITTPFNIITPEMAKDITLQFNKYFAKQKALRTAEKKVVKDVPPPVHKSGKTVESQKKTLSDMTAKEIDALSSEEYEELSDALSSPKRRFG